jgi:hypothetical protein
MGGTAAASRVDLDRPHIRAISQDIGKRLRAYLGEEAELPASLRKQVDRLGELDGQSVSGHPAPKARQTEAAANIEKWLSSPGLKRPT